MRHNETVWNKINGNLKWDKMRQYDKVDRNGTK